MILARHLLLMLSLCEPLLYSVKLLLQLVDVLLLACLKLFHDFFLGA